MLNGIRAHADVGSPVNVTVISRGSSGGSAKLSGGEQKIKVDLRYSLWVDIQIMQLIRIAAYNK
jgi:hypothetical protein